MLHGEARADAPAGDRRHGGHDGGAKSVDQLLAADQLLVALDVESRGEALALADRLRGAVGGFKIGSRLFTAEGPDMVRALVDRGDRVFLDLKWHEIPNTVATAVAAASNLRVWMVNVHASGGSAMLRAAGESARDTAARLGRDAPLVIA